MSISQKAFQLLRLDIVVYGVKLVSSIVVARKLGPELMGIWLILMLIPTLAEAVGRIKMDVASVYFIGKKRVTVGEMSFLLHTMSLLSAGVVILLFFALRPMIEIWFLKSVLIDDVLIYLVLVKIPLVFIVMNYSYLLISKEDVKSYNMVTLINVVFADLLIIGFLLTLEVDLKILVLSGITAHLTTITYAALKVHKTYPMVFRIDFTLLKEILNYCSKLYIQHFVTFFNQYISNFLVAAYLKPSHMAFFSIAKERTLLINKVPGMIGTILYPVLSNSEDRSKKEALVAKSFKVSIIITGVAGTVLMIAIKPLVFILYGEDYLPSVPVFWILIPVMVFFGSSRAVDHFFMATGRPQVLLWVSIIGFFVQVGFLYVFMQHWGYVGAAIAVAIGLTLDSFLRIGIFLRNATTTSLMNFIPKGEDLIVVWKFALEKIRALHPKTLFAR